MAYDVTGKKPVKAPVTLVLYGKYCTRGSGVSRGQMQHLATPRASRRAIFSVALKGNQASSGFMSLEPDSMSLEPDSMSRFNMPRARFNVHSISFESYAP